MSCDCFDADCLRQIHRFPMSRRLRRFKGLLLFLFVVLSSLYRCCFFFSGTTFNYEGQEPDGLVHMLQLKKPDLFIACFHLFGIFDYP